VDETDALRAQGASKRQKHLHSGASYKRLSSGRFRFWPHSATEAARVLEAPELQVLLMAGDPGAVRTAPAWRRLAALG
jgi:hypothetical protein